MNHNTFIAFTDPLFLDLDPESELSEVPKRVEIWLWSRIQGRNHNTSSQNDERNWTLARSANVAEICCCPKNAFNGATHDLQTSFLPSCDCEQGGRGTLQSSYFGIEVRDRWLARRRPFNQKFQISTDVFIFGASNVMSNGWHWNSLNINSTFEGKFGILN